MLKKEAWSISDSRIHLRHINKANYLFLDAHASAHAKIFRRIGARFHPYSVVWSAQALVIPLIALGAFKKNYQFFSGLKFCSKALFIVT